MAMPSLPSSPACQILPEGIIFFWKPALKFKHTELCYTWVQPCSSTQQVCIRCPIPEREHQQPCYTVGGTEV